MLVSPEVIRGASFAVRITDRKAGRAAIIYRRQADPQGRDRLQRVSALSPLAYTAALSMLREGIRSALCAEGQERLNGQPLVTGPYYPVDADWGARVACFALVAAGLRDGERMLRAAENLRHADPTQAAWWLGLLLQPDNVRALRALRILTEAVQ